MRKGIIKLLLSFISCPSQRCMVLQRRALKDPPSTSKDLLKMHVCAPSHGKECSCIIWIEQEAESLSFLPLLSQSGLLCFLVILLDSFFALSLCVIHNQLHGSTTTMASQLASYFTLITLFEFIHGI